MANNKDIKKNKPKKEKKKRKPIYEIHGFVLTIPEERLKEMLLEMSKTNPEKAKDCFRDTGHKIMDKSCHYNL